MGRNPEELAEEFEPTAQTIRNWVRQLVLSEGHRHDGRGLQSDWGRTWADMCGRLPPPLTDFEDRGSHWATSIPKSAWRTRGLVIRLRVARFGRASATPAV